MENEQLVKLAPIKDHRHAIDHDGQLLSYNNFISGMNSILIYVGHELLIHCFPVQFWVPRTHPARFSMELWGAILWAVVAYCLHRSGVYLAI